MHREDMRREINLKLFISLPQTAPCKQGVRVGANRSSLCEESESHFNFSLLSDFVLKQY